ncbi:MAG: succinate dehydrogenase, cytochrome b556 subunit [Neomegalonema sp.]|nr:succinate dehydrogenase, cytochrome b556 subunit [Neomegalonema sp.]
MSDVNRGDRPLSPHLQVYRPQITSVLSILHRATGVGLTLAACLIVWWLFAAATSAEYFAFADDILTSLIGQLILIGSLWALMYHSFNGIRHLFWDAGYGFELNSVTSSGWMVVIASFVATALIVLIA